MVNFYILGTLLQPISTKEPGLSTKIYYDYKW